MFYSGSQSDQQVQLEDCLWWAIQLDPPDIAPIDWDAVNVAVVEALVEVKP